MSDDHNITAIEATINEQFSDLWSKIMLIEKYKYEKQANTKLTSVAMIKYLAYKHIENLVKLKSR